MRFGILLLFVAVIGAFGFWAGSSSVSEASPVDEEAPAQRSDDEGSGLIGAAVAAPPVREAVRTVVEIVDARSDEPLPLSSLTWIDREAVAPLLTRAPDLRVDGEGRIEVDHGGDGRDLLARAPGYVPQFVELLATEVTRVALQPAAVLNVSVVSVDGHPVEGAIVVVSGRPGLELDRGRVGIGHPLSRHPRWQARTDVAGRATLDEVPPVDLVLNIVHGSMFPADASSQDMKLELKAGSRSLSFVMQEAQAAVFRCPSKNEVVGVDWGVDVRRLSRAPYVTSRLGFVREQLESSFPGALIYVQCDASRQPDPLVISCRATAADRSRWAGEWPLTPVSQIHEPVFLDLEQGPSRSVVIKLCDADGTEYDGMPIYLSPRPRGAVISSATGERLDVPYGSYRIGTTHSQPAASKALRELDVEVTDASPDTFTAVMPEPIYEVRVPVKYPTGEVLGPLAFFFSNEKSGPVAIVNWKPERGEIRQWMTGKQVSVRVTSVPYEDIEVGPVELVAGKAAVLEVNLELKK